jgi:hypothetical protein
MRYHVAYTTPQGGGTIVVRLKDNESIISKIAKKHKCLKEEVKIKYKKELQNAQLAMFREWELEIGEEKLWNTK